MTAVTSACTKKNLRKLVNFCVVILILKMEENRQHFQHIVLYYFKKSKNATETHRKDLCIVWRRGRDWSNVSTVFCAVLCWRFLTGRCSTVRQTSWSWQQSNQDINWEQSTFHHAGIVDILKISKSIKLLVKRKEKCIFALWKKRNGLFGQANPGWHCCMHDQLERWQRHYSSGEERLTLLLGDTC